MYVCMSFISTKTIYNIIFNGKTDFCKIVFVGFSLKNKLITKLCYVVEKIIPIVIIMDPILSVSHIHGLCSVLIK